MIQELDTVVLLHNITKYGLAKNDLGAVVHRYKNGVAFEVEFVTGDGQTVALVTLKAEEIRLMKQREILHVRELVMA
jgi:hypothetical protein